MNVFRVNSYVCVSINMNSLAVKYGDYLKRELVHGRTQA